MKQEMSIKKLMKIKRYNKLHGQNMDLEQV